MSVLGKRYAEGLSIIAREQNHLRDFLRELKQIRQDFDGSPELGVFLRNPRIPVISKKEALYELLRDKVSQPVLCLLYVLIDAGRIQFFSDIVDEYRYIANNTERVYHVEIHTPYELREDEYARIAEQARIRLEASEMRTEVIIDPSIRGGVIVRAGDFKYDFSLDGAIENLRSYLKQ